MPGGDPNRGRVVKSLFWEGRVAQLGERRVRNAEARGSIPLSSTNTFLLKFLTWVGLALVLAGLILGFLPMLPATAAVGTLHGFPPGPTWRFYALAGLGLALMLAARGK